MQLSLIDLSDRSPVKLYLAGPMRGYERHNFPMFDHVANELRRQLKATVFNPADHDREIGFSEETEILPTHTLQQMMRWDLARVMAVDAVVFLPGWRKSKGACVERLVAHYLGLPCFDFVDTRGKDLSGDLDKRMARGQSDAYYADGFELVRQPEYAEPEPIEWRLQGA